MSIQGKMIVLGVTGGIAAYKACHICSALKQKGADVRVIMTQSATKFVQPLTFQTLSRQHVYTDTFEEAEPSVVSHIDLADHADMFLVAPATANIIGKYALGLADDMLSTTLLATQAPVWMAPAMNGHMYEHAAVQHNLQLLKERGVHFLDPAEGQLACGYVGKGRLLEPELIVEHIENYFNKLHTDVHQSSNDYVQSFWKNKKVVITSGPTQESIDPVRYLSNHSSGKMGHALAKVAGCLGAKVTLVTGPTHLQPPSGVDVVDVLSTDDMFEAVVSRFADSDVVIKAAAVADYKPVHVENKKIKKTDEQLMIQLTKTKDILAKLGEMKKDQLLIGFAAETNDVQQYALKKLTKKNLDFVVANNVLVEGAGFGTETNIVTIYDKTGEAFELPIMSKEKVANEILAFVANKSGEKE